MADMGRRLPLRQRTARFAWRETRHAHSHLWFVGVTVVADILTGVVSALAATEADRADWQVVGLGAGGAALATMVIFMLFFVTSFISAPYRQRNAAWTEIEEIEAKRRSPFRLLSRSGSGAHGAHHHRYYAELEVYNDSDVPINDVEVQIDNLFHDLEWDRESGELANRIQDFSPGNLSWGLQNAPEPDTQHLMIPAHSTRIALVAYAESDPGSGVGLATLHSPRHLSAGFEYRIDLCVTGSGVGKQCGSFHLDPHGQEAAIVGREEGGLQIVLGAGRAPAIEFESWNEWWERHKSVSQRSTRDTQVDPPPAAP